MKKKALLLAIVTMLMILPKSYSQNFFWYERTKDTLHSYELYRSGTTVIWPKYFDIQDVLTNNTISRSSEYYRDRNATYNMGDSTLTINITTPCCINGDTFDIRIDGFINDGRQFFDPASKTWGELKLQLWKIADPDQIHITSVELNLTNMFHRAKDPYLFCYEKYLLETKGKPFFSYHFDITSNILWSRWEYKFLQSFMFAKMRDRTLCWTTYLSGGEEGLTYLEFCPPNQQ